MASDRYHRARQIEWFDDKGRLRRAEVERYLQPSRPWQSARFLTVDGERVKVIDVLTVAY